MSTDEWKLMNNLQCLQFDTGCGDLLQLLSASETILYTTIVGWHDRAWTECEFNENNN